MPEWTDLRVRGGSLELLGQYAHSGPHWRTYNAQNSSMVEYLGSLLSVKSSKRDLAGAQALLDLSKTVKR